MSFLTRTTPVLRVGALRVGFASTRAFSTTMAMRKSPVETAKDAAKTVDRKVSDKLVDGIEIGRMFARPACFLFRVLPLLCLYLYLDHVIAILVVIYLCKIQQDVKMMMMMMMMMKMKMGQGEKEFCFLMYSVVFKTAAEKAKTAAGLASDKASGKTAEVKGEAKGKAAEIKGEAKGKAEEVKGKL
ncbi:hypothetical protein LAWI1_G005538 [Lachnellula willkommii]|uniref:Uncharacterized protein n=1 Tax=Lachnellula willkommii TaxID=215461 RepID=A0A559M8Y5_9HELO|nr:hypothetical protein LAWI1_G005538 [Lachnellula willkommii]